MRNPIAETIKNRLHNRAGRIAVFDSANEKSYSGLDLLASIQRFHEKLAPYRTICVDGTITPETIEFVAYCATHEKTIVPLAPGQPIERLAGAVRQLGADTWVDPRLEISQQQAAAELELSFDLGMYTLFTSGSTGTPKGVRVGGENLLNALIWARKNFQRGNREVVGLASMAYFDIGLFEILYSLFYGHRMVIFRDRADPFAVTQDLISEKITTLFSAPSFFSQLSRAGVSKDLGKKSRLATIVSAGDFLAPSTARDWIEEIRCVVLNGWGPSETTVVNTVHQVHLSDVALAERGLTPSLPIGNSAHDMEVLVMSESGSPAEAGETGELVVLGPSVGLGYVSEPPDSGFQRLHGRPCFMTGDMGFRNSDGLLFINGRSAHLIKSAGYRIDPREIEFWIKKMVEVAEAVVVGFREKDQVRIGVVAVPKDGKELSLGTLRRNLRSKVPHYMLPSRVLLVSELPMNLNGKLDRPRLVELLLESAHG